MYLPEGMVKFTTSNSPSKVSFVSADEPGRERIEWIDIWFTGDGEAG